MQYIREDLKLNAHASQLVDCLSKLINKSYFSTAKDKVADVFL